MPSLGADMDRGTIVEWRVRPGDAVHRGDIVAVVDTDKSDIDVEIFEDGVIEELLVEPGHTVPVGTVLARVGSAAEGKKRRPAVRPSRKRPAPTPIRTKAAAPAAEAEAEAETAKPPAHAPRASPLARARAAANRVDLAAVAGSGPGGAVLASDLERVTAVVRAPLTAAPARKRASASERQAAMRHTTGVLMARSKKEIPHYYLATTADLGPALAWLADTNAARPVTERLLPAAVLLKATALAIHDNPRMNGFWNTHVDDDEDSGFEPSSAVHLGVAVSLRGGGLIAPAIHDADLLSVDELMEALGDLVQRARAGTLRSSEMSDSTITVTNLGDQGVEEVFGVIYPPQVALVGFGRIVERPWASGGMLGVRPVVRVTLSADHRVSDGHDGARFLATIDRLLHCPEEL
jgi:pyruvate dehydrogenase E2 component (dihydrolipoamide acetyltransferase)